jgi:hypothetical protein
MCTRLVLIAAALLVALGGAALLLPARTKEPATDATPKTAASRITHVTVYPNSALVTREVEVPAGVGAFELVVGSLPEHTLHSSLYAEGSDGIRVLTTRFRTRPIQEDTREEVRKLETGLKALQEAAQKLSGDIAVGQQNLQLLAKLENFTTASTQHATEKGKLDADAAIALARYLMEGRGEKSKELVELRSRNCRPTRRGKPTSSGSCAS